MLRWSPTAQCLWEITGSKAVIDNVPILIIMDLITSMVASAGGSARHYSSYTKEGAAGPHHGKMFLKQRPISVLGHTVFGEQQSTHCQKGDGSDLSDLRHGL